MCVWPRLLAAVHSTNFLQIIKCWSVILAQLLVRVFLQGIDVVVGFDGAFSCENVYLPSK